MHRALSQPGWLPGQMSRRGGDVRPLPAPQTPRPRSPLVFFPIQTPGCETSFQSPPAPAPAPAPDPAQPRPGPPTSAPAGLPLPRGHRRRRPRGRKNTGKLVSYLQRARAHTRTSSLWANLSWPGQPRAGVGLSAPRASEDLQEAPTHTPWRSRPYSVPRLPGNSHTNNLTAPPPPIYKSVFSLEIQIHNLPPPTFATPKSDAVPGGSRIHWRTTSRLLKGGERDRGGATQVLPSRPPRIAVLHGPWLYRTRAGGAPAGGGYQVRARTTALIPRTADKPRAPRAAQAGSTQPGFRRSPGPRPPAANGSSAEPGRQPLARLSSPRRTLKEKSPRTQRPAPAPQESTGGGRKARGRRAPGSGSKLTGRCERRCRRWRTRSHSRRSRCRAGPAPTGRSAVRAPRLAPLSSCSARTGAGVTALRRRCSLALSPDRCSPGRLFSRAPAAARFFYVHRQ